MEQRFRYRTCDHLLSGDRGDPGGGVSALPSPRYTGGKGLWSGTHGDPFGGCAGLLPEHVPATRHTDHGDLYPAALRRRRQFQRHVRRAAHQDQQDRQNLRLGLQVYRSATVYQSRVAGLHRGRLNRLSSEHLHSKKIFWNVFMNCARNNF